MLTICNESKESDLISSIPVKNFSFSHLIRISVSDFFWQFVCYFFFFFVAFGSSVVYGKCDEDETLKTCTSCISFSTDSLNLNQNMIMTLIEQEHLAFRLNFTFTSADLSFATHTEAEEALTVSYINY